MWWNRRKQAEAEPPEPAAPDAAPADTTPVSAHRTAFIMLGLAGAVVVSFGIAAIAEIFVWSFFALVLTICVYPLRSWLERHGVKRGVATVAVILAVVLLLGVFVFAFFFSFAQFLALLPQYTDEFQTWASNVGAWLSGLGLGQQQIDEISTWFDPGKVLDVIGSLVGSAAATQSVDQPCGWILASFTLSAHSLMSLISRACATSGVSTSASPPNWARNFLVSSEDTT